MFLHFRDTIHYGLFITFTVYVGLSSNIQYMTGSAPLLFLVKAAKAYEIQYKMTDMASLRGSHAGIDAAASDKQTRDQTCLLTHTPTCPPPSFK